MRGLKDVGQRWSDGLADTDWRKFECLLADYYRRQGYAVEHVGSGRAPMRGFDGGIDLKLRRDGRYVVVQCKHWNAKQVPHNVVHELLGIMVTEAAHGAIVITSGEFTPYALESAMKIGSIELVDGTELRRRLGPVVAEPRVGAPEGQGQGSNLGLVVAKVVVPFLCFLLVVFVAYRTMTNAIRAMPAGSARPAATSPVTGPAAVASAPGVELPGARARPDARPAPIAEIGSPEEMMDAEELTEWKRKNAEAMNVLESRVPELQRAH